MTAEEISSKVRQILQDYRRRNDYTLEDAQRDMANLMGVHAAQQPKMPTEEEVHKAYVNFQWALAATDDYHEGLEHGFKAGVEWLRNQIG